MEQVLWVSLVGQMKHSKSPGATQGGGLGQRKLQHGPPPLQKWLSCPLVPQTHTATKKIIILPNSEGRSTRVYIRTCVYVLPDLFVPGGRCKLQTLHSFSVLNYYCLESQRNKVPSNHPLTDIFKREQCQFLPDADDRFSRTELCAGAAVIKCDDNQQFSEGSVVCLLIYLFLNIETL